MLRTLSVGDLRYVCSKLCVCCRHWKCGVVEKDAQRVQEEGDDCRGGVYRREELAEVAQVGKVEQIWEAG